MLTTYELPLNERIRTLLRLEFLFKQASYSLRGLSVWDSRFTISTLLEINNVISRIDIQTELSKELTRQKNAISSLSSLAGVDTEVLNKTLAIFDSHLNELNLNTSKPDYGSELLKVIQQRDSIPGGSCDFDIPIYHHWLNLPAEKRIHQLEIWLNLYTHYDKATTLILNTLRDSSTPKAIATIDGFYQQSLNSNAPYQLIRVTLPAKAPYFPELSGGKHRFSIRFMQLEAQDKPIIVKEPIEFHLSCCLL